MAARLPPAEIMAEYRANARARAAARRAERDARRDRGWAAARCAADILRQDFGATRVVAFGSLVAGEFFDERSDIDLAVWGTPYDRFWLAVRAVAGVDCQFEMDLVRAEEADARVLAAIEAGGVPL